MSDRLKHLNFNGIDKHHRGAQHLNFYIKVAYSMYDYRETKTFETFMIDLETPSFHIIRNHLLNIYLFSKCACLYSPGSSMIRTTEMEVETNFLASSSANYPMTKQIIKRSREVYCNQPEAFLETRK